MTEMMFTRNSNILQTANQLSKDFEKIKIELSKIKAQFVLEESLKSNDSYILVTGQVDIHGTSVKPLTLNGQKTPLNTNTNSRISDTGLFASTEPPVISPDIHVPTTYTHVTSKPSQSVNFELKERLLSPTNSLSDHRFVPAYGPVKSPSKVDVDDVDVDFQENHHQRRLPTTSGTLVDEYRKSLDIDASLLSSTTTEDQSDGESPRSSTPRRRSTSSSTERSPATQTKHAHSNLFAVGPSSNNKQHQVPINRHLNVSPAKTPLSTGRTGETGKELSIDDILSPTVISPMEFGMRSVSETPENRVSFSSDAKISKQTIYEEDEERFKEIERLEREHKRSLELFAPDTRTDRKQNDFLSETSSSSESSRKSRSPRTSKEEGFIIRSESTSSSASILSWLKSDSHNNQEASAHQLNSNQPKYENMAEKPPNNTNDDFDFILNENLKSKKPVSQKLSLGQREPTPVNLARPTVMTPISESSQRSFGVAANANGANGQNGQNAILEELEKMDRANEQNFSTFDAFDNPYAGNKSTFAEIARGSLGSNTKQEQQPHQQPTRVKASTNSIDQNLKLLEEDSDSRDSLIDLIKNTNTKQGQGQVATGNNRNVAVRFEEKSYSKESESDSSLSTDSEFEPVPFK